MNIDERETVLVYGSDGYIGHALVLRLLNLGYKVVACDNFHRREVVKNIGSKSLVCIDDYTERVKKINEIFPNSFTFNISNISAPFSGDILQGYDRVYEDITAHNPIAIINLAQNPSAPYSQIDREKSYNVIHNNIMGTINILWAIYESGANPHLIQIGSMGEYDPAVNVNIPEGLFEFELDGRKAKESIFPRRPGSFYHASKVGSSYFIDLACRSWGLRATDIMQGVVYGGWTPEIEQSEMYTRLDSDESMGTVVNRFIAQSLLGEKLTVFGKGLHKRGFLALNDSIQCLLIALKNPPADGIYQTWNQLDEVFSMNEIAQKIIDVSKKYGMNTEISYIPSPRSECVDDHYYTPVVDKLANFGFQPTRKVEEEISFIYDIVLKSYIKDLKNVIIPQIKW